MAKRRGVSFSPVQKKKRSDSSSVVTPAKQERNAVNDGILNLYKKDLIEKEKASSDQDDLCPDKQSKSSNAENVKTPSREKKRKNTAAVAKYSTTNFNDIGGMTKTLKEVLHMFLHYKVPYLYELMEESPVRGILLHGPSGCGKTHLASAIAGELGVPIIKIAAPDFVCGISGESESKIREAFDTAVATGRCIFFIDEIDAICPKRETTDNGMMRRMVTTITTCFDDLHVKDEKANVMVIAATNFPDSLDPALRRGGRFDREIAIGIPNEKSRLQILEILCKKKKLSPELKLQWLAKNTPGYVGADLRILLKHAMTICFSRICKQLQSHSPETFSKPPVLNEDSTLKGSEINEESAQKGFGIDSVEKVSDINGDSTNCEKSNPSEEQTQQVLLLKNTLPASDHQLNPEPSPDKISLPKSSEIKLNEDDLDEEREWFTNLSNVPQEVITSCNLTEADFQQALQMCTPYARREGFASVDNVTWDDIGALSHIKKELQKIIIRPVMHSKLYENNELPSTKGILLFGPKGCGKTLLAKVIASECSLNFLSVNGPELLSMYVGESEKAVRKCFERARNSAPCVIFFDEFDALCPPRSNSKDNAPIERVVNQLLTETCGTGKRKQVILVAATNRLDKIDSAMLRPGRLEKVIYVGLPTTDGRTEILKSITKNKTRPKIADDVDLKTIACDDRCKDFSGADLAYLVSEATNHAVDDLFEEMPPDIDNAKVILTHKHFNKALDVVKPSISEQDRKYFEKYSSLYTRT